MRGGLSDAGSLEPGAYVGCDRHGIVAKEYRVARSMRHIGILAHSADGAALCFLEIVREASRQLGAHEHPEMTLSILPMGSVLEQYERNDSINRKSAPRAHGSAARRRRLRFLRVPRQHRSHRAGAAR